MKKKAQTQIQIPEQSLKEKLLQSQSLSTNRSSTSSIMSPQKRSKSQKGIKEKQEKKKFSWPVFKTFFLFTMKRWKLALFSLVMTLASGISTSIVPYEVGNVLDSITMARQDENPFSLNELNGQIIQLFIIIIFLSVTTYLRFTSIQYLQQYLAIDMKTQIYSKFIKNDMHFFQQYKSGEFVSRLGTDINQAKSAVSNSLTYLIRSLVTMISNIVILFIMSWKLSLAVMTIIPFYVIVTTYYSKRSKPLIRRYQDVAAEMSAHVSEKFSSIQVVKAYSCQDKQIATYTAINFKAYEVARKKIFVHGIYFMFSTFLPAAGVLIVLWYGGKLAIQGNSELTPGQLTSFIMYCTYLANNTSGMSDSYASIINGTSAVQKVFQMMSYQPEINQGQGLSLNIQGQITFQNVCFNYPNSQVQIFNNLSFTIGKGQYIGFVGQSGSGKSTIIKLIQKFYRLKNGKILFGQIDSQKLNMREIRKQIGMVNQQATLFSGTIEENIAYGLQKYTQEQLISAASQAGCLQFICNRTLFPDGFETLLGEKGSNLSGGQRQRISIARALIRKPKIIIFDEATSALDANSQQMVQQSIENLAKNQDRKITIIVIAHRLSTIMNADRILVMKQGKLIEQGKHEQLKQKKGYYYELVQKQLQDN